MLPQHAGSAMIGRTGELAQLREAFDQACAGRPSAVLVTGEAGIGKSRLIGEFCAALADRALILSGQCIDLGDASAPYGPLTSIVRDAVAALGVEAARGAVGAAGEAFRAAVPALAESVDAGAPAEPGHLPEATANLIEAAARRMPVVLVIEDLQWADDSTIALLSFLVRAIARARVLLLLSYRVDEARRGGTVRESVAQWERSRLVAQLALPRLDPAQIGALADSILGETLAPAAFDRVVERSEGVPFYVEELLSCADADLPDTLRDLLLARFDRLGTDAKHVVRAISGSDGPLAHPLLAELTSLPADRIDRALREAVEAGIVRVAGDSYVFRHALLREAVHDDLLPGERIRLHRAYAQRLQATPPAVPAAPPFAALAYHWHQAREPGRALAAAVGAMQQARRDFAFAAAARFGELALEMWDGVPDAEETVGMSRVMLLSQLGSILRNAGLNERSLAVADAALEEAGPDTARETRVRLLRDKALCLTNLGRDGAIELLGRALGELPATSDDHRLRSNVLNTLAGRRMVSGDLRRGIDDASRAYRAAERAADETEMSIAANVRGICRVNLGDIDGGLADCALARRHANSRRAFIRYSVNYSDLLFLLGRFRDAVAAAEEGIAGARRAGVERTGGVMLRLNMIEPLLELGETDAAERLSETVLPSNTWDVYRLYVAKSRVGLLVWRGRADEAARLLRSVQPAVRRTGIFERQVWYGEAEMEALVAWGTGNVHAALQPYLPVVQADGPALARRRLLPGAARAIAEARAAGSDCADAARVVREVWDSLPEAMRDPALGIVVQAFLEPSPDLLAQAREAARAEAVPAVLRPALGLELARALLAGRARHDAVKALDDALKEADRLGHEPLRRDIAAFAASSGLLRRRADTDSETELTARQRQVLELVAEGLSNRQIGDRLFISAKTASVHVSAILRKLGVASRTEAAVAARERSTE